jgi:hypothetical protein
MAWTKEESVLGCRQGQQNFLFSKMSKLALGLTQSYD